MERLVYKNKFFSVYNMIYPDLPKPVFRIKERDAVVIIPVLRNKRIIVERQLRPSVGRWLYELPAGHVDPGESYIGAARRELREETGYRAGRLRRLFTAYPAPGLISQRQVYFVAEDLVEGNRKLESDERITVSEYSINELFRMIKGGRIIDNKTIAGVLYYYEFTKRKR